MSELPTLIRKVIESRLAEVHTMIPGQVVSYDAKTETATVRPVVENFIFTTQEGFTNEVIPDIDDVPIQFPRGGKAYIKWKLEPGDGVALVFSEVDPGVYRDTGSPGKVGDITRHSMSYPVAIAGITARDKTGPAVSGEEIVIESTEIHLGQGAEEFVALANLCKTNFDAIQTTIGSYVPGAAGGSFLTPYAPSDVSSSKVKAK